MLAKPVAGAVAGRSRSIFPWQAKSFRVFEIDEPRHERERSSVGVQMAKRLLRCAIEQLADWHPHLFLEPHVVAFVAVASRYSDSPARFVVECDNIKSRRVGEFGVEVAWHDDTAAKAKRMRATIQTAPLVELAAVALALILAKRVVPLGKLDVTDYGARADYRSRKRKVMLEVSGTEVRGELERRYRDKVAQACKNPLAWDAYVSVCAFAAEGHRIIFGRHSVHEVRHDQGDV